MFDDGGIFYRGILLGLMVAAPVGPVGLLTIRRTIQKGLLIGFCTGFGAAFADAIFTALAAFGVAAITDVLTAHRDAILCVGGAFLLFIAFHTWHDKPRQPHPEEVEKKVLKPMGFPWGGAAKALVTSFVITMSNPGTIVGVLAVVATFGGLRSHLEASAIIAGIFTGSSLWWLLLSGGVSLVRKKFTEKRVTTLNRVTAVLLTGLAVWALVSGIAPWFGVTVPSFTN